MSMMTSLILKFEDSSKSQKSLNILRQSLFFLQTKNSIHDKLKAKIWKKIISKSFENEL